MCGSVDGNVKGAIINLKINESGKCQRGGGISRRLRYSWKNKTIYFTVRCISCYIEVKIPKAGHVVHESIRLLG